MPSKSSRKTSAAVGREMHAFKQRTAKSGPKGRREKVKIRRQPIATGLSKARKAGKKPPHPAQESSVMLARALKP